MLLHKQDRVFALEQELKVLDANEPRSLFLGIFRRDANEARQQVLAGLDAALKEYGRSFYCSRLRRMFCYLRKEADWRSPVDDLVERTDRALRREDASIHSISNLQNWVNDSASLARDETAYLAKAGDLMTLSPMRSNGIPSQLERLIENILIRASEVMGKVLSPGHWSIFAKI